MNHNIYESINKQKSSNLFVIKEIKNQNIIKLAKIFTEL